MPLFKRRRDPQARLDSRMGLAVEVATKPIAGSPVDEYFAAMLMSCVSAGASAIADFAETTRELVVEDVAEDLVVEFLQELDSGHDLMPPLRVASWAYISRLVGKNWGDRYDEVLAVAMEGFGVESEVERRLATYGPHAGSTTVGTFAKFQRIALESIIESVMGRPVVENAETLVSTVTWGRCFTDNWDVYKLMLERLAPDLAATADLSIVLPDGSVADELVSYAIAFNDTGDEASVAVTWCDGLSEAQAAWIQTFVAVGYVTKLAFNFGDWGERFLRDVTGQRGFPAVDGIAVRDALADRATTYFARVYQPRGGGTPFLQTPNEGAGVEEGRWADDSAKLLLRFISGTDESQRVRVDKGLRVIRAALERGEYDPTDVTHMGLIPHEALIELIDGEVLTDPGYYDD
jgi:hypothetical protein